MYNWILYTGKLCILNIHTLAKDESLDDPLGMTAAGSCHHINMDKYYTSPALFSRLRSLGFGASGTLRLTRRGVPAEAKATLEASGSCGRGDECGSVA